MLLDYWLIVPFVYYNLYYIEKIIKYAYVKSSLVFIFKTLMKNLIKMLNFFIRYCYKIYKNMFEKKTIKLSFIITQCKSL